MSEALRNHVIMQDSLKNICIYRARKILMWWYIDVVVYIDVT